MAALKTGIRFLVLGGLLYAARWRGFGESAVSPPLLSAVERDALVDRTLARAGSANSSEERDALAQAAIDEEILVREAIRLGLAAGDPVIARRIRQTAEFTEVSTDDAPRTVPLHDPIVRRRLVQRMRVVLEAGDDEATASEIEAYYRAHAGEFVRPARVRIESVFVADPSSEGRERAAKLRARLLHDRIEPGAAHRLGDPHLPRSQGWFVPQELVSVFGEAGAARIAELPLGEWSELIASPFGLHLVRVAEEQPAVEMGSEEAGAAIRTRLAEERRRERAQRAIASLRARAAAENR